MKITIVLNSRAEHELEWGRLYKILRPSLPIGIIRISLDVDHGIEIDTDNVNKEQMKLIFKGK